MTHISRREALRLAAALAVVAVRPPAAAQQAGDETLVRRASRAHSAVRRLQGRELLMR